jgi:hypothetical protein
MEIYQDRFMMKETHQEFIFGISILIHLSITGIVMEDFLEMDCGLYFIIELE